MPSSPLLTVPPVIAAVRRLRPHRILDIGVGTGKWGFLLREQTDFEHLRSRGDWELTIDGVEGYGDYIGEHQRAVYDTIHIGDALDFLRAYDGDRYDVALALDIIEHFEPKDGAELAAEALRAADVLVVTTPKRFYRQRDASNPLQDHRSWWPRTALADLASRLGAQVAITQTVTTNIAVFSRTGPPVKVETHVVLNSASALRDRLIPELMYYRLRRRVGPMLAPD